MRSQGRWASRSWLCIKAVGLPRIFGRGRVDSMFRTRGESALGDPWRGLGDVGGHPCGSFMEERNR